MMDFVEGYFRHFRSGQDNEIHFIDTMQMKSTAMAANEIAEIEYLNILLLTVNASPCRSLWASFFDFVLSL
jgi:hypothetical protein